MDEMGGIPALGITEMREMGEMGETPALGFSISPLPPPGPGVSTTLDLDMVKQHLKELDNKRTKARMLKISAQVEKNTAGIQVLLSLSLGRSAKDLTICAREISKRSMHKHRQAIGDGKLLFDPNVQDLVMRGAIAMGMVNRIPEMKEMSRICIVAGDAATHYSTLEVLEDLVESCLSAMKIFPSLQQSHAWACSIVSNYPRFKQLFPESFRD